MRCDYILGLPTNPKLEARAAHWHEQCRVRWKPDLARVRRFHQFQYAAGSWSSAQKVIARVEATALGTDARFIVTNLSGRGKVLYEKVYCARADGEHDQGSEALHALRQDRVSSLAGLSPGAEYSPIMGNEYSPGGLTA